MPAEVQEPPSARTRYSSAPELAAFQVTVAVVPLTVARTFVAAVASGSGGQAVVVTVAVAEPSGWPEWAAVTVTVTFVPQASPLRVAEVAPAAAVVLTPLGEALTV